MLNRILKLLSVFLSLVLIFNLLPLSVLASNIDDTSQVQPIVLSDDASSGSATPYERMDTATIVEEDTSRRGEYYKEFVLNNGLRLAAVYQDPIHFEEGGQWKDIDNTLKMVNVKGVAGYTNTAGVWQAYFPQQLTGSNAISLTKDGYTVSFGMAGELTNSGNIAVASIGSTAETLSVSTVNTATAQLRAVDLSAQKAAARYEQTVLEKHSSTLAYSSVYNNAEIVYNLSGNRLKESIVMAKYNASLWGYRYNLNTGGLLPVLLEDNTIELRHPETAEVVMVMPAPFMVDANDEYNYDVDVSLVQKNGGYLLSYYVPRAWLASADRAWPVVLDPIVQPDNSYSNIQDISFTPTVTETYRHSTIKVGYSTSNGIYRTYIRFAELPDLSKPDNIAAAYITLKKPSTSSKSVSVEVHKVNQPWTDRTISWGNNDAFNITVEDSITVKNPANYTWDITNIVRGWYEDPVNPLEYNTGMMFKTTNTVENAGVSNWHQFCSSNYAQYVEGGEGTEPILAIIINNTNGLEDCWDYTTVSADRAGTGYIQNYSGSLMWVHNDMGFDGNRMPVSIKHIYNPMLRWTNKYRLGYGWQTNYHQTVRQSSDNSYVWTDGDGTLHYFYPTGSGVYQDEDNLHLTLSLTDTGYEITDRYGNKSVFQFLVVSGSTLDKKDARLTNQINNQSTASSITISYVTSDSMQIFKITDGVGRVYALTYAAAGQLDKIQFKASETSSALYTVQFAYNNNSQLSTITYADGSVSSFTYNNDKLTKVQNTDRYNVDGYNVNVSYVTSDAGKPHRVASIVEKDGSQTGSTTTFTYGLYRTKITTQKSNPEENQYQVYYFDMWGNTVSSHDEEGRAVVSHYAPVNEDGDPTHLQTIAASLQVTPKNMLSNSSFEETNIPWTPAGGATPTIVSSKSYLGANSLHLSAGVSSIQSAEFSVLKDESVTFSAYLQAENLKSAQIGIDVNGSVAVKQSGPDTSLWTRISVTYTNNTSGTVKVRAKLYGSSGYDIYVDCVQLEKDKTASHYNLLENTDFDDPTIWTDITAEGRTISSQDAYGNSQISPAKQLGGNALKITGEVGQTRTVSQTIPINQTQKRFVISGWGKVLNLPSSENTNRMIALQATVTFRDNCPMVVTVPFGISDGTEWQFVAAEIDTSSENKVCTSIKIEVVCDNVSCTAYFDGIGLYMESLGESYTYDAYGNLTSSRDVLGNTVNYDYDADFIHLIQVLTPKGAKTRYTYDDYHNVSSVMEYDPDSNEQPGSLRTTTNYTYDQFGNLTETAQINGTQVKITSVEYSDSGNYLSSVTDENGNTTLYRYAEDTGMLTWVMYPNDTEATATYYTYDNMFRPTAISSSPHSVSYSYEDDQLKTITSQTTQYTINYGLFGLRENLKAGSYTLATYEYTDYTNRYLKALYYGAKSDSGTSADYVVYVYDEDGRVIEEQYYEDGSSIIDSTISYLYNDKGQLAVATNSATGSSHHYQYDDLGRVESYYEKNNTGAKVYEARYGYDEHGNVSGIIESINGATYVASYSYDDHNRPSWSQGSSGTTTYNYDNYGQLTSQSTEYMAFSGSREYTYRIIEAADLDNGKLAKVSSQVSGLQISVRARNDNYQSVFANYQYTYDNNGNIASVTTNGKTTTYTYDSQNQLIREANEAAGKIWEWEYDSAGNIASKKIYNYQTGAQEGIITYNYALSTDSNNRWNDRLISYGGKSIEYYDIGNPKTYDGWTFTWEKGRQLASMSRSGENWVYTYDSNGLLTKKEDTVSGKICEYIYSGGQLRYMYDDGYSMIFEYDSNGVPLAVICNGWRYFYITNLQGDVVAIIDEYGCQVAEYGYDAWGNLIHYDFTFDTDTGCPDIGIVNPLRYRGYVYDRETGLYYLQSRYYNPEWGRFINADCYIATGQGLTGNNMFAYCGNNPVMYVDPTGEIAVSTVVWIIVGIAALATAGTITYGAVTDTPVVIDISGSAGTGAGVGVKVGISIVLDFKNESVGFYPHYGYYYGAKYNTFGASYGVGLISNYENEGDYAGPFTAMGGGYLVGFDHCYDPRYPYEDTVRASSLTFGNNIGAYYGYDKYEYLGSIPFGGANQ